MNLVQKQIYGNKKNNLIGSVIAAYHLSDGVDSKNGYNGTVGSSVAFASGVNGNAAVFNATSNSYISIPDTNDLSFTDGTNDLPFSIKFNFKTASIGQTAFVFAKEKNSDTSNDEYCLVIYNNAFYFRLLDKSVIFNGIGIITSLSGLSANTFYNIIYTYDGSKSASGLKCYINNSLRSSTAEIRGTYTGMKNGTYPFKLGTNSSNEIPFNGTLDELYIFNKELNNSERTFLQSSYYPF